VGLSGVAIGTYRPQYRPLSVIRYINPNPLPTRYTLFITVIAAALPLPRCPCRRRCCFMVCPPFFLSCIRMLGWGVCIRFNVGYGTVACVALKRGGASSIHDAARARPDVHVHCMHCMHRSPSPLCRRQCTRRWVRTWRLRP